MVRTVKKAVSAAMALVMTTGMFITGNGNVVKTYAEETTKPYVNSRYVEEIGDGQYSTGVAYDKGIILLSNVTSSTYADKTNLTDKISLSADSSFAYVDKDGIDHELKNEDENGKQRFDTIYGSLTQGYYQYNIVGKDSKLGVINDAGELITLNGQELYDNIYMYNADGIGHVFGLEQYTSDNIFDYTVVDESGKVLFTVNDCTNVKDFSKYMNQEYTAYFLLFEKADGTSTLMDFSGKIWHDGEHCKTSSVIRIADNSMSVLLSFDNSYGYYNYTTGEKFEKEGSLKRLYPGKSTLYLAVNNGQTIIYDSGMNEKYTLDGEYYYLNSINSTGNGKAIYILCDSDYKKLNILNKDGSKWFDSDSEIKMEATSIYSAEGGIFTLSDGNRYYVSDGGDIKIKLSDLQVKAHAKIREEIGNVRFSRLSYYTADFGLIFTYTMSDDGKQHSVVATKSSGYSEFEYIDEGLNGVHSGGTSSSSYGIIYRSETVDKDITLKNGNVVNCTRKLVKAYNRYENTMKEVEIPLTLYQNNQYIYYYSENGDFYSLTVKGFILNNKENQSQTHKDYKYQVNDTGSYIYSYYDGDQRKYKLYDNNDKEINIGLDELYSNPNYSNITLNLLNFYGKTKGYVSVSYYDNVDKKSMRKIYTYFGEYVMDFNSYFTGYYSGVAGNMYFANNTTYRFKDISKALNDSELKEDSTIKIGTIKGTEEKAFSGLKENSTIEDIRKELPKLDITVVDSKGNELAASKPIGTGCKIQVVKDGKVIDTATVVVKGDTDGSGTINVLDMEEVQKSILGIGEGLAGAYNEAARLTGKDKISVLDMEAIQKNILGLEMIN